MLITKALKSELQLLHSVFTLRNNPISELTPIRIMKVVNELTSRELDYSIRKLETQIKSTQNIVLKSKDKIMTGVLYKKLNQYGHRLTLCISERYNRNKIEEFTH